MENNRSLSVDITKGTAIIAIVLGHIAFRYLSCRLVHCGAKVKERELTYPEGELENKREVDI